MSVRRLALAALAASFVLAQPAWAQTAAKAPPAATQPQTPMAGPSAKPARAPSAGQSAARERQKTCGAQWRALAVAEKAAQGPKWPQYWSKCNKRLKGGDKA